MSQAGGPGYAPGYDLFKLLISVTLTIFLVALLLSQQRQAASNPTAIPPQSGTFPNPTTTRPASSPTAISSQESLPPGPAPTQTPGLSPTPIVLTPTFVSEACPSSPSRIQVGDEIRVLQWVYFRTGPGQQWSIRHANQPGTELSVIGGPVFTCRETAGRPRSYTWWNLRMQDGEEGWSAEAQLILPSYFLETVR